MQTTRILIIWCLIASFMMVNLVMAHSGRTDSNGCHNDNINGGYHCHNSDDSSSSSSDGDTILLLLSATTVVAICYWLIKGDSCFPYSPSTYPELITNSPIGFEISPVFDDDLIGATFSISYDF